MCRLVAVVAAASCLLAAAGCGATPQGGTAPATLGAGALGGSTWAVTAYRSVDEGRCIQIAFSSRNPGGVCEGTSGGIGTTQDDDPAGQGTVIVIGLDDAAWTDGVVTFDDHSTLDVTATAAGDLGRYLVFAVPAPRTAEIIDLHNAATGRKETRHLR